MLSLTCVLTGTLLVFLAFLGKGDCLQCYDCTNLQDKKCGVSWGFSGDEANDYIVECEGGTVACRKVQTTDTLKGEEMVIRSCWNSSGWETLDEDFLDCRKMASIGKACYCNKDGNKPCNNGQHLYAIMALISTAVATVLALIM
ncbi:hypothetical protein ACF0H5_011751 [Mactra antiquata]